MAYVAKQIAKAAGGLTLAGAPEGFDALVMADIARARGGLTAFVARDTARALIGDFCEIYVKAPLEVCAERDTKGLYAKALAGELKEFTGVNDPYEAPENPELVLDTEHNSPDENADRVLRWMEENGYLAPVENGELATV